MGLYIGAAILAIILLFVVVLLIRAMRFTPYRKAEGSVETVVVNEEKIIKDMVDMIRCKTVSYRDDELIDWKEFEAFQMLLAERFPLVHENGKPIKIGKTGLLFHILGKEHAEPSVLMAHYDVVPVEEEGWEKPAFDGIIEEAILWGRGTLDTKGTLCGIMEGMEQLLSDGFCPKQDIYLSFSGDEEINGSSCPAIVDYMEKQGIKPALVVDEGGAVVDNVFPGVTKPCALVGIGEKGMLDVECCLETQGGHASTPPVHSPVGVLAKAVVNIEAHPFPSQLTKPVSEMFDILGRDSSFAYKILFANLWCFRSVFDTICKKAGGELNAMMRTTCAITRMEGSKAFNVLPPKAKIGANLRLLGDDTMESAERYLNQVIGNPDVKVNIVGGINPSIYSDTDCRAWEDLKESIQSTWPEAVVAPYLMMACSDSRHYCRITDRVYRFSAMHLSKEERGMIHGNNERVPLATLIKTVEFYVRLIRKC